MALTTSGSTSGPDPAACERIGPPQLGSQFWGVCRMWQARRTGGHPVDGWLVREFLDAGAALGDRVQRLVGQGDRSAVDWATRTTSPKDTGPMPTTTVSLLTIGSPDSEEVLACAYHIADQRHTGAIRQMNVGAAHPVGRSLPRRPKARRRHRCGAVPRRHRWPPTAPGAERNSCPARRRDAERHAGRKELPDCSRSPVRPLRPRR